MICVLRNASGHPKAAFRRPQAQFGGRPPGRYQQAFTDVDYSVHRDPHWISADENHANSHRKIKAAANAIGVALGIGE
jgi:hypothetical protein